MSFCPPGWRQKLHFLRYCAWILLWILRWGPSWVYFSTTHDVPLAWLVSHLPGVRVIYHEHDASSGADAGAERWMAKFRPMLFERALCIWPNRARADVSAPNARDLHIVWNCPSLSEVSPPRESAAPGQLAVFFHGSINAVRLPVTIISALAALPEGVHLTVAGYETMGSKGHVESLQQDAARLGIAHRLRYLGPIPLRADLLRACRLADVGLAFMPQSTGDVNEANMTGASNKPFDYLASGVTLLVTDRPDWRELFADAGMGLACDPSDPGSIVEALRWFLDHPAEMRSMSERGRRRVLEDWNYERQFQAVKDVLGQTAG